MGKEEKLPKIIVYTYLSENLLEKLRQSYQISYYNQLNPPSGEDFTDDLKDAVGLIGSGLHVDEQLLDNAPRLKIVVNISVGYNNLNIDDLTRRRVMATNTPDILTETTADAIFGLLVAAARRIPELDYYVKSGRWQDKVDEKLFGIDVHNKIIGIIGMGRIGGAVAKRAHKGFNMKILYHNRTQNGQLEKELNAKYCSLKELLKESNFICLVAPLTPETENLIGKEELMMMKKDAVLVNGSRGELVNEEELIASLKNREIYAAGLDVYQKEPVDLDNQLLKLSNVVTLPHIGSATLETRYEMAKLAIKNLTAGVNGERPPNLINPEVYK
ncbi:2-hydroxyacid dehydrogenase [Salinicoccus sp. Marseille-QA3877]